MTMKTIPFFGLMATLVVLGTLSSVSADVIIPGEKSVSFSYEISNMNEYKGYVFVLFGVAGYGPASTARLIRADEPIIAFYKFARPSIYAIKETDFNDSVLTMDLAAQEQYFVNNTKVIKSNIELSSGLSRVPEDSPLASSKVILTIVTLDASQFVLQKIKIIYTYTDGSTEEQPFVSQDITPSPSRQPMTLSWSSSLWFIVLPGCAVAGIMYVVLKRRRKK